MIVILDACAVIAFFRDEEGSEGILASMFDRFWWIGGAKLGRKNVRS